jgi:hypothetical protein
LRKKSKKDIEPEKTETKSAKNNQIIPWIVFLFSISIVLISFTSVMFPALIQVSDTVKIPGIDPVIPDPYLVRRSYHIKYYYIWFSIFVF